MKRAYNFRRMAVLSIALTVIIGCNPAARAASPSYVVAKTVNLPGNVRWDLLTYDNSGHKLFIARGDHVDVLDTQTMTISGTIEGKPGVHGVALAPDLGMGFISNGKTADVTAFNTGSLKPMASIPAEDDADSIVYDAVSQRVFSANGDAHSLTAIDPIKGIKIETVPLSGKPETAVADDDGKIFVNIVDKGLIDEVDARTLKVLRHFDISKTCTTPVGLAIDLRRERLFSACRDKVMDVVDIKSGNVLSSLPIGEMNDGAAYDPGRNLVFASNGDGSLTVVGPAGTDSYKVMQTVPTMKGARTIALDPRSHTIYLVSAEIDHVDAPTPEHPHPRPQFKENTFEVIAVAATDIKTSKALQGKDVDKK